MTVVFFQTERVRFLKQVFEGVPGGVPPRDHHHRKEEGLFYKRVQRPEKVYDFCPLLVVRKTGHLAEYAYFREYE